MHRWQSDPSVTRLIHAVQQGRASAVGSLLEVYFDRLVGLIRCQIDFLNRSDTA